MLNPFPLTLMRHSVFPLCPLTLARHQHAYHGPGPCAAYGLEGIDKGLEFYNHIGVPSVLGE